MKYVLNCILIGNTLCGKSSFSKVLKTNKNIEKFLGPTIGVDVTHKSFLINNDDFKIKLWDLSGNHRFIPILHPYISIANIALLFFSYDNYISKNDLQIWNDLIKLHSKNTHIYLIGSQSEKKTSENSWFSENEMLLLKSSFPYKLYDIDCTNFNDVNKTMLSIIEDYKNNIKDDEKNKSFDNKIKADEENRSCFSSWLSCIN